MTEAHREHLSAGMDGALSKEELRFLLRRFEHDAGLCEAWSRYHVARDGLRRQLPPLAAEGFAERVMQAIGQEQRPAARRSHWLRWSAGGAIAASVAAAALMLAQPGGNDRGRAVAAGGTTGMDTSLAEGAAHAQQPATPAAVPPWLSASSVSQYSQRASATLGDAYGDMSLPYANQLSPYRLQRAHELNRDGAYLLLVDPRPAAVRPVSRQAAASAQ
ncbi:sigma-E factor negative regulatory protein [Frateuria sp. Soil773]|uniref:sigma-E factor negative regulatory protein n=1 Tax=Frateuria sp. Soil773 TaxID=1736407 RepID=UPI0012F7AB65|nr:sigma-E factor negative regulatory protein [Frateuria sp. Soil773]